MFGEGGGKILVHGLRGAGVQSYNSPVEHRFLIGSTVTASMSQSAPSQNIWPCMVVLYMANPNVKAI